MDKLYLVTRSDLMPGARASQLCHALRAFVEDHPTIDSKWFKSSNTLVLLEVRNEKELEKLEKKARTAETPISVFREPDLGNALTAIALGPSGRKHVRSLSLALS